MSEHQPSPATKRDVLFENSSDRSELENQVVLAYELYRKFENIVAPHNARNHNSDMYVPPKREMMRDLVKKPNKFDETMYYLMLDGILNFCTKHRGRKQLPCPHPTTRHSLQFPKSCFEIKESTNESIQMSHPESKLFELHLASSTRPIFVEDLRHPQSARFIIVRPKIGKLGVASASDWECLIFDRDIQHIADWCDSNRNPRYAGCL